MLKLFDCLQCTLLENIPKKKYMADPCNHYFYANLGNKENQCRICGTLQKDVLNRICDCHSPIYYGIDHVCKNQKCYHNNTWKIDVYRDIAGWDALVGTECMSCGESIN